MSFIDLTSLGLVSTPQELLEDWLAVMQAAYPSYTPSAGNPEYVQAQGVAAGASDIAQTAVVVPSAIFRAFGTKLANLEYLPGVSAIAVIQITAVDDSGYTLLAGTQLTLGGVYPFVTNSDLTIPNGSTTGTVTVIATSAAASFNGATNPAEFISIVDWIANVTALAPASGGQDPEDDASYQNRLAALLRLQAPRPITASDFATMALSFPPAAETDQQEIGRSTALDGYVQASAAFTVSENATTTLTVTSAPAAGVVAAQGASITGSGILSGTLVTAATGSTITISQPATATATGVTATVSGTLGNERTVTTCVTLADGTATNSDTKTALQAWLGAYREANFVVDVVDPTYTTIYVTVNVHPYDAVDPATTQASVQSALMYYLSPLTWGLPNYTANALGNYGTTLPFGWLSSTIIRYDKLIGIVQGVSGVDYVPTGTLKVGTSASPTGTGDLVIPGPIALPESTTASIVVNLV